MYTPSPELLAKYADVLIKFALWSWEWVKQNDVVLLEVPESAKAMIEPLMKSVLSSGAHPIINYIPEWVMRSFYDNANIEQCEYVPKQRHLWTIADITHRVRIISEHDKHELDGISSEKLMSSVKSRRFIMDELFTKEGKWELTRTLGLFGTQSMADEAWMSLEEYRNQIISACYLDYDDPIAEWKKVFSELDITKEWLDNLKIQKVHITGPDTDLHIQLGNDRKWLWWSGRNIPSYELFISPDRRWTNGWIRFNQPLYRYGSIIKGIQLWFENGIIIKATAEENEQALLDMIAIENANKIGEFSMTDRRLSKITRFMAETLYDENIGGEFGNTHIAVWMAFKDSFPWDQKTVTEEEWNAMGYNNSAVHTDIVTTTPRTIIATLEDGSELVIYKDGEFIK